jgi:hypothetical protein
MMVYREKPRQINFCESSEEELADIWEIKARQNSLVWSRRDDKLDKKNQQRSNKIQQIRYYFLSETKERGHNYEKKGDYLYKSKEHFKQFIEIVEAAGLLGPETEHTRREPYNTDGYYHNVSIPKEIIQAIHYPTEYELSIIENMNMSELGGMDTEVDF